MFEPGQDASNVVRSHGLSRVFSEDRIAEHSTSDYATDVERRGSSTVSLACGV